MATLYELTGQYKELADLAEDIELFQDTLESMDFHDQLADKAESYVKVSLSLEAQSKAIKEEVKKLQARAKSIDNNIQRLKENLAEAMQVMEMDKIDTGLHKLSFRKSKAVVIDDEHLIPSEFTSTEIKVNKTELKKAIQGGLEIKGAHIEEKKSLSIR